MPPLSDHVRRLMFVSMLFVAGLAFIFVYLRGQDRNWDLLNYHFYSGYSLLHGRYLHDIAAANLQSFLNPMANLVAYLALRYFPFPFSGWSILLIQLLSLPTLVLIARELGKGLGYERPATTEILAFILTILAPLWWSELGTTFFSSSTAPLILWGLYLLIREDSQESHLKYGLVLAGLFFGFAVGLKLTNAPFAIAAGVSVFCISLVHGLHLSLRKIRVFIFGGFLGVAPTAWWNWYLWDVWQSPLFPLYNAIFKSQYFDFINWRDMRWQFAAVPDFATFIVQTAFGTEKTSEIPFADARLLIAASLIPGIILSRPANAVDPRVLTFLLFFLVGFCLWVISLAYQRYLIPLELLFGLVIWIFVVRLAEDERVRIFAMGGLVAFSFFMLKIPDWGHAEVEFGSKDPFSIKMPDSLSRTPARYIVHGVPMSYILPSLHPDSVFYGTLFSRQVDALISKRLNEPSSLPLRIIVPEAGVNLIWNQLEALSFSRTAYRLKCIPFTTGVGRYISCDANTNIRHEDRDEDLVRVAFSQGHDIYTEGLLWVKGLSVEEPWGRWSEGGSVELGLVNCLPEGQLQIEVTAHAFGPHVGQPIEFALGTNSDKATFRDTDTNITVRFNNRDVCADKLEIRIPEGKSPQELGLGPDPRKLGIGFVRLRVTTPGSHAIVK